MLLRTAICDDNKKDAELIRSYLEQYEIQHDVEFEKNIYTSSKEMRKACSVPNTFHIAFLDVDLLDTNGIQLAEALRNMGNKNLRIVFISNYPQYMQDSFPVHPVHYLIKPVKYQDFSKLMNQTLKELTNAKIYKTLVKTDGGEEFINIHDIIYIEALKGKKNSLAFHMKNGIIEAAGILKVWEDELTPHKFFSPHRGILLNLKDVHFVKEEDIILHDGTSLPLSRRKAKELHILLSRRIISFDRY